MFTTITSTQYVSRKREKVSDLVGSNLKNSSSLSHHVVTCYWQNKCSTILLLTPLTSFSLFYLFFVFCFFHFSEPTRLKRQIWPFPEQFVQYWQVIQASHILCKFRSYRVICDICLECECCNIILATTKKYKYYNIIFFPISRNLWLFSSPCKNFTEKNFFTHSFFFEMQRRHKGHKVADGVDLSCRCYARSA